MARPSLGLTVAAAALGLCAVGVLIAQAVQYNAVPSLDDWAAATEVIKTRSSDGDAFRVEPQWDSRPRVFLPNMTYEPSVDPTWFDLAPHTRIWTLVEAGREDAARARFPAGWQVAPPEPFGSVSLLMAERSAADPTPWDALTAMKDARIRRDYGDRVEDCKSYTPGQWQAWQCRRRDAFLYVGETMQTVTNDVHRCLWAMPIDGGGKLRIQFDGVPTGTLRGHYGQPIDAVRSRRGAPVTFEVKDGDRTVHSKTFSLSEEGFIPWQAQLEGDGKTASLTFVVSAASQVDRFFCFTARVVP
jgi:hypothetical protein